MPPYLPALEKILNELCVNIGKRPTGSKKNYIAHEYIRRLFIEAGYDVESQYFDCIDWSARAIDLRIGTQPLPASVSPYSLPCEVTASPLLLENISQLEASDLRGRIAVLSGELTKEALMPKNFRFWNPEEHRKIIWLLEDKRPEAVITVSFHEQLPIPIIEDGDFEIPCASISKATGPLLFDPAVYPISLRIDAVRKPAKSANVIARSQGKPGKKKIVISAHMDTKPGTPGALDNASGLATLLLVGQLLQQKREELALEFVCFNGEDYYSNAGEVAYLDCYQSEFGNILLNINCDGVGLRNSRIALSYMGCPEPLISVCEEARKGDELFEVIDPWPQGDHMLFAMNGVPALTVTSTGIFSLVDTVIHTGHDTIDLLEAESILKVSEFLEKVILATNSR